MTKASIYYLLTNYLAENCALELTDRIVSAPGYTDLELSVIAAKTSIGMPLYAFKELVEKDSEMRGFYSKFEGWATANTDKAKTLAKDADLFASLIVLEINKIYQKWYKQKYNPPAGKSVRDIAGYLRIRAA